MQRLLSRLKKTPRIFNFLRDLKRITREALFPIYAPKFNGWYGMTLHTDPPWINCQLKVGSLENKFLIVDDKLKDAVKNDTFKLIQFEKYQKSVLEILNELTWRHYIVYWSAYYATKQTNSEIKNLVEVGVADGLTAHYALNAVNDNGVKFKAYLYDTWGRVDLINPSTSGVKSQYSELDIACTKKNLMDYNKDLIFKRGLIPETFTGFDEPQTIVWLHIDLNSAPPTLDTLTYYWDKLEPGGIVLFDDYAQPAYKDTKRVVDEWLLERTDSLIMQSPTSQALIFKTFN